MSTLVAQHDKNSYCSSFTPKHPKHPYRHYETRNNSASQMTSPNYKTSNLIKPATPGLSPEDSTEKGLESTKSPFGKEEAPENTPVAVQLHVPASTDPSPLRDVCQRSIDHSSSNVVRRVLNYLSKPRKNYMEFHGVGAREFGLILEEAARVSTKPRHVIKLTYDCNTRILIIMLPTVLHEASFDDVKDYVGDSIRALPYDRTTISPKIHMNWPLDIPDGVVNPDMTISITALEGPTEVVLIPFFGECALSETDKHVFGKTEKVILAYPDTICVVVVLVREATLYANPGKDYTALNTVLKVLLGSTDSDLQPLTLKEFINLRTTPRSFGEPTVIGDHTWCHLSSVEYFVWVKGDDGPIDIRSNDPAHMVYGTLVPTLDMDAITEMLEDSCVTFQKQLIPDLDCTILAEARVTSFTDWYGSSKRILSTSDITAHKRYLAWHKSLFNKTEDSDDASYVDSQEESEEEQMINEGSECSKSQRRLSGDHAIERI
ncbi:hypothetical protein DFJ58DRAFT_878153 [Suillus subalutaceus]|uniref:uncharacterized protein n=1 Tax=Suillus subalutaceus TaxID=48586 RepID=UPI001B873EB5|nr:uncharacterized protein DFJ58DRAFT_878153 [Suillus subalutaceus]KAG1857711.1 hypothetical protein DFJ58DRAFT_878153 [Suillus subalutaceus]